jgi:spermidine/putrescine transport system permease protein
LPAGEAVARAETAARRREVRRSWWLAAPALALLLIGASGPLVIVLLYSFLEPAAYSGVVWQFSTEAWFRVVFNRDIFDDTISLADAHLTIFWRSVSLSLMTTLLTLALGFPTAYFIATRPERQRPLWLFLITIPFWTNLLIRTFAIMEVIRNEGILNSLLLGLGLIESPLQILYTDTAVLIGMAYVYLPLMVLPLYASMERLDFRLVEAAYDLYASRPQVLRRVIVPLVRPGIVAGSILVFVPALGAYVTPRVLGGGKRMMLGNLIELQFGQGRNWPLGAALAVTLLLIVGAALVVYVRNAAPDDHGH